MPSSFVKSICVMIVSILPAARAASLQPRPSGGGVSMLRRPSLSAIEQRCSGAVFPGGRPTRRKAAGSPEKVLPLLSHARVSPVLRKAFPVVQGAAPVPYYGTQRRRWLLVVALF